MAREDVDIDQLDCAAVSAFLADYVEGNGRLPTASVLPLLDYLRRKGVVAPEPARPLTLLDRLIGEYREWLLIERALAATTVRGCEELARRFLVERISPVDEFGVVHLTGADVTGFLLCARAAGLSRVPRQPPALPAAVLGRARTLGSGLGGRRAVGGTLARGWLPTVPAGARDRAAARIA